MSNCILHKPRVWILIHAPISVQPYYLSGDVSLSRERVCLTRRRAILVLLTLCTLLCDAICWVIGIIYITVYLCENYKWLPCANSWPWLQHAILTIHSSLRGTLFSQIVQTTTLVSGTQSCLTYLVERTPEPHKRPSTISLLVGCKCTCCDNPEKCSKTGRSSEVSRWS